jgi:RNA methyltransferase, TrmH family
VNLDKRVAFLSITSRANPRLRHAAELVQSSRARRKERLLALHGLRELQRGIDAGLAFKSVLIGHERWQSASLDGTDSQLVELVACLPTSRIALVSDPLLHAIEYGQRNDGLLAIAVAPQYAWDQFQPKPQSLIVIVDGLEKPGNLGAIARTADAVGADGIVLTGGIDDWFNPNAIRASTGTILSMPLLRANSVEELLSWLAARSIQPITITGEAPQTLWQSELTKSVALVFGAEDKGLSPAWRGAPLQSYRLLMAGQADSLNVSVTAAVSLFEVARQRYPHRLDWMR